jgi:hypothetical protein
VQWVRVGAGFENPALLFGAAPSDGVGLDGQRTSAKMSIPFKRMDMFRTFRYNRGGGGGIRKTWREERKEGSGINVGNKKLNKFFPTMKNYCVLAH